MSWLTAEPLFWMNGWMGRNWLMPRTGSRSCERHRTAPFVYSGFIFCTEGNAQGVFCPGGLTDVRLFSGHTHPALHLTTPNCVLCSSPWLSYRFDFLPCKLLAWRVLSSLSFLSLTCQRTVRSLFWVKPFLKMLCCTMNWLIDWLTDWLLQQS